MRIVVFGGTTEGRELSKLLHDAGADVTVCVATQYGEEEQGQVPGVVTHVGPLTAEEKQRLLRDAALCVDATHPYADRVTASVRAACAAAGVEYLRLLRKASEIPDAVTLESAAAAAAWLREREGRVLLTTGAKELAAYAVLDPARLVAMSSQRTAAGPAASPKRRQPRRRPARSSSSCAARRTAAFRLTRL